MGRNGKRPPEYVPLLQFNLRSKLEGGKLRVPGELKAGLDAKTRKECLVLVHGFNNTDSEAAVAYLGFRSRQKEIFGTPDFSGFERRFGDTFWPGDADWWWFFDKVDFLIYPAAVHTAVNAGRDLANLLWEMPNLERVDFIAHSLGCRVVLETLRLLRQRTLPIVGRIVLMAAAVPSEMLEPGGKFFDLVTALEAEGTHIQVLYSEQDWVLHYTFPPGQALAGGDEASSRAIGRFGWSPRMPGPHATGDDRKIAGALHGDYWGHSKTPPSREATEAAGRFLSLGDLPRELGNARALGDAITPEPPRQLGISRPLGDFG